MHIPITHYLNGNISLTDEARYRPQSWEIIRLVASVRSSVCLWALSYLNRFYTVQDLCVFVSNQEMFAIKSCAQRSRAFIYFIFLRKLNDIFLPTYSHCLASSHHQAHQPCHAKTGLCHCHAKRRLGWHQHIQAIFWHDVTTEVISEDNRVHAVV